jgi:hypothetical protein
MNVSNISLSYAFLGIALIAAIFFIYFKVLIVKTSPDNDSREAIIGEMKDPDNWRNKNNKMAYIFLFWTIISTGIFIYFKFFHSDGVTSLVIPFGYLAVVAISAILLGSRNKNKAT